MNHQVSSHDLYAACAAEGSAAQREAFTTLWGQLYRIAYAMVRAYPDPEALAADCTQIALIKVHRNLAQCASPERFSSWAAQVLRRTVLDEIRRPALRRRAELPEDGAGLPTIAAPSLPEGDLRATLLTAIGDGRLSERSQRVVLGRYFADSADEALAHEESARAGKPVLPSHIQVTRAKNLSKLRADAGLMERLREGDH
jgi:RNA polymerase sigma factor (sigma-70 family)